MMSWPKIFKSLGISAIASGSTLFAIALSPLVGISASVTTPSQAQIAQARSPLHFPPADDRGAPRTGGGGTRSGATCVEPNSTQLTAVMPTRNNIGRTITNNPTLYWYVPQTQAQTGEFVLIDEDGNEIYIASFPLPNQPGLVSLDIPEDSTLKVGKDYLWYFSLICNPQDRSQDLYVSGVIQRTELSSSLKTQIEQAEPLEQAMIYAEYRIWYETLKAAQAVRTQDPNSWLELLTSVGLEEFSQAEITPLEAEAISD